MATHTLPTKPNDPNYIPPALRRPRPGYHREIVDWRAVPMQAKHLPPPRNGGARCERCFGAMRNARHVCRWSIERVHPCQDLRPAMVYVPVFRWFKDS
jgi:hypothetical protein